MGTLTGTFAPGSGEKQRRSLYMASEDPRQSWAAPGGSEAGSDADNPAGGQPGDATAATGGTAGGQPGGADWGQSHPSGHAGAAAGQWGQPAGGQWGQPAQPGQPGQPPGTGGGWDPQTGQTYQTAGTAHFQPMQSHRPGVIPLRALRLGEILDGAFKALRHNPKIMFGVTLPVAGLLALLQAFVMYQLVEQMEYDYLGADLSVDDSVLVLSFLVLAINMLAVPLVTGILTISVSRSSMGKKLTLGETMQLIKGRKAALLGMSLLVFLISILPAALPFLGGFLTFSAHPGIFVLVLFFAAIGAFCGIVYLTTRLLFVTQVVVLERQPVFQAIKRGWLLTRGSFWRLLGIYILASLIGSVVASIIATPLSVIAGLVAVVSLTSSAALLGASTVVSLMITIPFSASVASILYIDVRMRKEGLDIELARAAGERA